MAADFHLVALVLAIWTAVAFVLAVAVGHTIRRVELIPVRVRANNVVDLRRVRGR